MTTAEELKGAFDAQVRGTRRLLERVPLDQKEWTPHEKSMNLGRLTAHVASLPRFLNLALTTREFHYDPAAFPKFNMGSTEELLTSFDAVVAETHAALAPLSPEDLELHWQFFAGGKKYVDLPRRVVFHNELGHAAHHRGQLTVYLRMLDVPLPPLFGPTADESF